jgi:Contractile injection system tape measure protein
MTASATITIRHHLLDVEVNGTEQNALVLQRRLSSGWNDTIGPTIERILSEHDRPDVHLLFDRISLDLGDVELDHLETGIVAAVHRELVNVLRDHPAASSTVKTTAAGSIRRSRAQTLDGAIRALLLRGRLPWWFRPEDAAQLEALMIASSRIEHPGIDIGPLFASTFGDLLRETAGCVRFVRHFSADLVRSVLRNMSASLADALRDIEALVDPSTVPQPVGRVISQHAAVVALHEAATGRSVTPGEINNAVWLRLPAGLRDDPQVRRALRRVSADVTRDPAAASGTSATDGTPITDDDLDEGIVVPVAGIVLLHPFLLRLFEVTGVATGDELLDPDRALVLLHYLATGDFDAPEHAVAVAKLLCGLPLDRPLEPCLEPSTSDLAEADEVLHAVLGHWGALGGSSIEALRWEFLGRPGILRSDPDNGWVLHVEARTADVLLDQLPWGLSMVKTPWMDDILRVDWR